MTTRPSLALLVAAGFAALSCGTSLPPPRVAPHVSMTPAPIAAAIADPAPVIDGDVTFASVRGMQILIKHIAGAELTTGQLYVRGGARNWSKDTAGIESVAFDVAASGGTRSLSKGPFARKLASLGAWIKPDVGNDFTILGAQAPSASWDEAFSLLADAFVAPALPESEFEIIRQRKLSRLRHEMESGDGRVRNLARRMVFAGHPYENRPLGTVATVGAMKFDDLAPYLGRLRDTRRLLLVVVGDVDAAHVIDQARGAFASVPRGSYSEAPIPGLHFGEARLAGDPFELPTNYIQSRFAAPKWNDPDFVPMWIAIDVLQEHVMVEVRTKRNLSYAPAAFFDSDFAAPFGALSVTAVDPSTTMRVMTAEARRLQTELVPDAELAGFKSIFVTNFAREEETTEGMATWLGRAQLLGGDWHLANAFLDRARTVTSDEVRAVARKYIVNLQTAIVGDPTKLDPKAVGAESSSTAK